VGGRLGANLFCLSEPSLPEEGTLSIPARAAGLGSGKASDRVVRYLPAEAEET